MHLQILASEIKSFIPSLLYLPYVHATTNNKNNNKISLIYSILYIHTRTHCQYVYHMLVQFYTQIYFDSDQPVTRTKNILQKETVTISTLTSATSQHTQRTLIHTNEKNEQDGKIFPQWVGRNQAHQVEMFLRN